MKVFKLFAIALFASVFVASLVLTPHVSSQSATEAPTGFDNQTNGFEPQGTPVPPGTVDLPVRDNFEADIGGAAGLGIRTCWLAPPDREQPPGPDPTARIARLPDIERILG